MNSCSANALAAALHYDETAQHQDDAVGPSRLFIYFNERLVANVVDDNTPVSLRDGYRAITRYGACPERMWPYEIRRFRRRPTAACYRAATHHTAIAYYRIRRAISHLRACLAERFPFVFAVAVHRSFLSRAVRRTGLVPVPTRRDRIVGGHAILAVGYDHARRVFIIRNSWGPRWGDHGYGYLPYRFVASSSLSWDFWTMRRVS